MIHFQCSVCNARLEEDRGDGADGALSCTSCAARFPRLGGVIADLLPPGEREEDAYGELFRSGAEHYEDNTEIGVEHSVWVLGRIEEACPAAIARLDGNVIEIGSGTGLLTHALRDRDRTKHLWVTDLSPEMLRCNWDKTRHLAEPGEGIEYMRCNARAIPCADEAVDAVIGFDILHHILDYREGLREIARTLAPGGALIVKEPHRNAVRYLCLLSAQLEAMDRAWNPFAGLTRRDRQTLSAWREHHRLLIQADEHGDTELLSGFDDKYSFRPDQLEAEALEAGFSRFEEINVLARHRESHIDAGMYIGDMLRDWMNGARLSRRGQAWAERAIEQVDYWMGDALLEAAPMNTVFVFWK